MIGKIQPRLEMRQKCGFLSHGRLVGPKFLGRQAARIL